MVYSYRYRDIKYEVGRLLLGLRTRARLTQTELAELLGVSMRTIQNWEAGENYPKDDRLRTLIETYLRLRVFYPGQEHQEALKLWDQVSQDAPQKLGTFDEIWFNNLLNQLTVPCPDTSFNIRQQESQGAPFQSVELYGRETELIQLEEQVCTHNARLVGLMGIGGVGKTALAFKLTQIVKTKFQYVIWYSLANIPTLETCLSYFINIITGTEQSNLTLVTEPREQLGHLLELLQKNRCLLVLDNFETILASSNQSGNYLSGYEGYGLLLELLSQQNHQSCLLITSREKPKEFSILEKRYPEKVSSLLVRGLSAEASYKVLAEEMSIPISATTEEWQNLINYYCGNPLALKLLVEPLSILFRGNVAAFLAEKCGVFDGIRDLLKPQFERLSELEQQVLYWLAVQGQPLSIEDLKANFGEAVPCKVLAEALILLGRRSLLESSECPGYFGLQPVVQDYLTDRLALQVNLPDSISTNTFSLVAAAAFNSGESIVASSSLIKAGQRWKMHKGQYPEVLIGSGQKQSRPCYRDKNYHLRSSFQNSLLTS
jgi:transcriptional regulator with XRE-family HTH domain